MVAKRRRALLVLALCVLGALVVALPASAAAAPLAHLETVMTGEQEVPGPGDPNGIGEAKIKVFRAKVCYTLTAKRIAPATAAHIHKGPPGVAGPIRSESTRLNSSHANISYAVFCLKKK